MTAWLSRVLARMAGRARGDASVGRVGENTATAHLRANGYFIRHRNLRMGRDEIDIVALTPDRKTLVIVEVKTRADANAQPHLRIDAAKQHRLSRAAAHLIKQPRYRDLPVRFDVVSVLLTPTGKPQIEHFQHAFASTL